MMKTIEDFAQIRAKTLEEIQLREGVITSPSEKHVLVCAGTGCTSSSSPLIIDNFSKLVKENDLQDVQVIKTGCFGLCAKGPVVVVYPEGTFYSMVQPEDVGEIVEQHLKIGSPVERLLYKDERTEQLAVERLADLPFFKKQQRTVLKNCGLINPENISEYLAVGGYLALEEVLMRMSPEAVVEAIKQSGLRGRGGGGFPTGLKWEFAAKQASDQKYIICNADEGDPGAFMDRSILEGDPHAVLEGMIIAGYAIGADQGYVYVRAEYPLAIKRLQIAISAAEDAGLLGKNILGSNFSFTITIKAGAGAFVCGEETALINSIEGKRGMPRIRPPFPAIKGLWDKPTNNNNVETYANVPLILRNGVDWYKAIGTEKSKGTKVFSLTGNINETGLAEVPMGTTLREIIFDIGGGIQDNKNFKAVQIGGPSGGCLPEDKLDLPVDYDSLLEVKAMMGSGGLVIMDENTCMVDVARYFLTFSQSESCGKCTPCREGTTRMMEILTDITEGRGKLEDIATLERLAKVTQSASLCGLGQTAANPVLSTLRYFKDEYLAHIEKKHCPAKVCKELTTYHIAEDKCRGCTACARVCPANAITGSVKNVHQIDPDICIKCGSCMKACKFDAVYIA